MRDIEFKFRMKKNPSEDQKQAYSKWESSNKAKQVAAESKVKAQNEFDDLERKLGAMKAPLENANKEFEKIKKTASTKDLNAAKSKVENLKKEELELR